MGGQVHNILMDEFKKAHQKMFKNGYVESEYQQHNGQNDETSQITALDKSEQKLEVSRWGTISGNRPIMVPTSRYAQLKNIFAHSDVNGFGVSRLDCSV